MVCRLWVLKIKKNNYEISRVHFVRYKTLLIWLHRKNLTAILCIDYYFCKTWSVNVRQLHDDVIKGKHFPCHWSPVNSLHKGQWRGALMFYLICTWINGWVISGEAGDLRRHSAHYDVTIMDMFSANTCSMDYRSAQRHQWEFWKQPITTINSLISEDTLGCILRKRSGLLLAQLMVCCVFGVKQLPEAVLIH